MITYLPCGWHVYQLNRVCLVLAKARVLIAVFSLLPSRIPAFIFHRLPATLVRCPTWVACSLQPVHQMTVLATPHIIISDRCARVVVRAVRDQDIVAPALAPSHLFYTLRFPHNIRLLLFPFNGRFSRWTWVSRFRLGSCSSTCFGRKPLAITEMVLFQAGWTFSSFQCQSTEWNTKHWPWPVAWPHPFFIHHKTSDGRDFPPFTPAVQSQAEDYLAVSPLFITIELLIPLNAEVNALSPHRLRESAGDYLKINMNFILL